MGGGWLDGWTAGWMVGWLDGRVHEWRLMDGWKDGRLVCATNTAARSRIVAATFYTEYLSIVGR